MRSRTSKWYSSENTHKAEITEQRATLSANYEVSTSEAYPPSIHSKRQPSLVARPKSLVQAICPPPPNKVRIYQYHRFLSSKHQNRRKCLYLRYSHTRSLATLLIVTFSWVLWRYSSADYLRRYPDRRCSWVKDIGCRLLLHMGEDSFQEGQLPCRKPRNRSMSKLRTPFL